MRSQFVPSRGDLIWVKTSRQNASLQGVVVLSPQTYNERTGLALVCPVTRQVRQYPFEVPIPADEEITGAALSDQVWTIDWRGRDARLAGYVTSQVVDEIRGKLATLIAPET